MKQETCSYMKRGEYHTYRTASGSGLCLDCSQEHEYPYHKEPQLSETIAEEAVRIVYGDREQAYDDPNQNFRRLALMFQGVLDKKLAPNVHITPNDVALMMICLKISRESFKPSHDNRVDIIGYALCLNRIVSDDHVK